MALQTAPVVVTDAADPILMALAKVAEGTLGVVQAADVILTALREKDLTYKMKIHCRQVGFDPSNRDNTGGNANEIHLLGSDIAYVGWSWKQCAHALVIESTPGDKTLETFNHNLTTSATVPLAPVVADTIHFGSLTCGPTNQVLRCVDAQVSSDCPLLGESGRMSKEHIRKRDTEMAKAVDEGLLWEVLKHQVRHMYPEVLGTLQAAGNVAGHVQRKVHEVAGLLQMHQLWAADQSGGHVADWGRIKRMVLRTKPPFADDLDDLIAFLSTMSGGVDGEYLKPLAAFHNMFVSSSLRAMPGYVFAALADFPNVFLAYALLVTAYMCPKEKVEFRICKWVKPADIAGLAKTDPARLRAAESILRDARALFPALPGDKKRWQCNITVSVLTKLDNNMGRCLLGKQECSKLKFYCVYGVAHQFLKDLVQAFPGVSVQAFVDKWPRPVLEPTLATGTIQEAVPTPELYEVNAAGETTHARALLRGKALDLTSWVCLRSSDVCYQITALLKRGGQDYVKMVAFAAGAPNAASAADGGHGPGMVPHGLSSGASSSSVSAVSSLTGGAHPSPATIEVPLGEVLELWMARNPKDVWQVHPAWPEKRTCKVEATAVVWARATVLFSIQEVARRIDEHFSPQDKVGVMQRPRPKVFAQGGTSRPTIQLPRCLPVRCCCMVFNIACDFVGICASNRCHHFWDK